jgi:type VI secretion system protein ImpK
MGNQGTLTERSWNLALAFQEVLTAIVRVRFGRQAVQNAEMFRAHLKESLRTAAQEALSRGYPQEDVQLALYAIVAFLDESVMNSQQPVFADWPRLPLQEELFGGHVAGESFFDNLHRVLGRTDLVHAADLLELFYLCLLLGYRGRYAVTGEGVRGVMDAVRDRIQRLRGGPTALSPRGSLPAEAVRTVQSDPWVKRLGWAAVACLALTLLLFGAFKVGLMSGLSDLHTQATQVRL